MAIHGIQEDIAVTLGAATVQAEIRLTGVWHIHSISVVNGAVGAEAAIIGVQFGTDVFDPARTLHPLLAGNVSAAVPIIFENSFTVKGEVVVYGQVVHAGASAHTLTVLAYKVRER